MISFYNDNLDYNHLIWQEKEEEQNYFYSEGEDNKILSKIIMNQLLEKKTI